jgi:hypothetical protein
MPNEQAAMAQHRALHGQYGDSYQLKHNSAESPHGTVPNRMVTIEQTTGNVIWKLGRLVRSKLPAAHRYPLQPSKRLTATTALVPPNAKALLMAPRIRRSRA